MSFSWGDLLGTVSTGFDIYSGIQSMNTADKMYDIAAGSAAKQDSIASDQWAISKPVAQKEAEVSKSDANIYLGDASARAGILDKQYAAQTNELGLYNQYMPGIQSTYYQNMTNDLNTYAGLQGTRDDILTQQYANQLAGTGLNANLLDAQQSELDLYNNSQGIVSDFYKQSQEGLNVNEQMNMAQADVAQAFANTQAAQNRDMARMGVNPNSGRFADQSRLNATNQALATAGARTNARMATEDVNYNRLSNATNVRQSLAPAGYSSNMQAPSNTGLSGVSSPNASANAMNGSSTMNAAGSLYGSSANSMANLGGTAANASASSFASAGKGLNTLANSTGADSWLNKSIF